MDVSAYIDEIRLKLTGYVLEMELDDATITKVLNASLRELQRYYCSTKLAKVPFSKCVDLSTVTDENGNPIKVNAVTKLLRTNGSVSTSDGSATADPMAVSQWQLLSGTGNLQYFQDYVYNYAAWNTLQQIRNTTSTDLAFYYDKSTNKLYINTSTSQPTSVTMEYVPRLDSVEDINSDYWIDTLVNLAVAQTKIILGRIRTRYTQSGALWIQDGDTILSEGTSEYQAIIDYLKTNTQLVYPLD